MEPSHKKDDAAFSVAPCARPQTTSQLGEGTQIWMELPKEPCDKEKTARALHDMGRMQ